MIQICRKDKEKVYEAIRTGKVDAAEMSFPNLIDDIILIMKKHGLTDLLAQALSDKRRDNSHIPFAILLRLAVAAKLKCKTSLTDVPFAVTEAQLLAELGWKEYKIQLYYLPYRNDAGGMPIFPDIQKPGRRENICREIPASRSEELQGDNA